MAEKVGPTRLGKVVIILFIVALVAAAAYYFRDLVAPSGERQGDVDLDALRSKIEAPDTAGITTVSEYTYIPGERLPAVEGVSNYQWDESEKVVTVRGWRMISSAAS